MGRVAGTQHVRAVCSQEVHRHEYAEIQQRAEKAARTSALQARNADYRRGIRPVSV